MGAGYEMYRAALDFHARAGFLVSKGCGRYDLAAVTN